MKIITLNRSLIITISLLVTCITNIQAMYMSPSAKKLYRARQLQQQKKQNTLDNINTEQLLQQSDELVRKSKQQLKDVKQQSEYTDERLNKLETDFSTLEKNREQEIEQKIFDAYLANAQKNDERIYFISNELINSVKPESKKEEIKRLFSSTPSITSKVKISKIKNGFIFELNKKTFNKIQGHRFLVTTKELKQDKTALLNEFNIPTNITTPIETQEKIANRSNRQLLTYIYKTLLELPEIKKSQYIKQQQESMWKQLTQNDKKIDDLTITTNKLIMQVQRQQPQQQAQIQQPIVIEEEFTYQEQEDLDYYMKEFEQPNTDKKTLIKNIIITLSENNEYADFFDWYNKIYNQTTKDTFNNLFFTSKWKKTLDTYKKQLINSKGQNFAQSIARIRSIPHSNNTTSLFCLHKNNTMSVVTVPQ